MRKTEKNSDNKKKISFFDAWRLNLRAWRVFAGRCPMLFVTAFLSSAFSALSPYLTIWLSARLIDELTGVRDPQRLGNYVILILSVSLVTSLIGALLRRWRAYYKRTYIIFNRVFADKYLSMDFQDIESQKVRDLYDTIMQNRNWNSSGLCRTVSFFEDAVSAVFGLIGGIGMTVGMFAARVPDGKLSFIGSPWLIVAVIGAMIGAALEGPALRNRAGEYDKRYAPMARFGNRAFGFYGFMCADTSHDRSADLRMYSQQENVCDVHFEALNDFTPGCQLAKWAKGPMGVLCAASSCMSVLLSGVVYLFVCLKAYAGAFGIGAVSQYVGASTQLFGGIAKLIAVMGSVMYNASFLEDTFRFLDLPNRMYQGSLTTEKRSDRNYEIEFRDVSFKYPGSETYALRHVNMKFRVGSRLAVVGMNGSGKTTFIKLLCRLYDPTEGQILLNGIDIRKYRYDDYINIFSVVFQDFRLLSMPLGENVACGVDVDEAKAKKCLEDAGFGERLSILECGLDTYINTELSKTGVAFSGGEKQKIAIARALYKDSPFIILDEPTAALDPIAEADIYSKFDTIAGDKTAVYISHRLSSCKFCDEIAVFDRGAVVQMGTHEALLGDPRGKYSELWHAQAQYYTEEAPGE